MVCEFACKLLYVSLPLPYADPRYSCSCSFAICYLRPPSRGNIRTDVSIRERKMGEIQSHTHPVSKEFGCGHIMTLCTAERGRGGMSFQHCFYFCFFSTSIFVFSSAGWAYQINWSNAVCLSVCLSHCLDVNRGGTNRNRSTETCNIASRNLLMNPDRTPKTRSVRPTLRVEIAHWKKWAWVGIFKPAEPHSPSLLFSLAIFSVSVSCDYF